MNISFVYRPELHLASVVEEDHTGKLPIRVATLLQCPGKPQAAINAYLAARYSRSSLSIEEIAEEVYLKGDEAAANSIGNIVHGYGHASVGDQAVLTICIENVTQFMAQRLFNMLSTNAGQERSTRYQKFDGENYDFPLPPKHWPDPLVIRYMNIMHHWIQLYQKFEPPTKNVLKNAFNLEEKHNKVLESRTLDCVRYFIPLGSKTSLALIASARTFSTLIGQLKGSNQIESRRVGLLIELLLSKCVKENDGSILENSDEIVDPEYVAEAATLIRHVEPNTSIRETTEELLSVIRESAAANRFSSFNRTSIKDKFEIANDYNRVGNALHKHLYSLIQPKVSLKSFHLLAKFSEVIFKRHDRHNPMGNLGQSGSICFEGLADIGTLKDLNRHRSMERWLPYLDDCYDVGADLLEAPMYSRYAICPYLNLPGEPHKLGEEYKNAFDEAYAEVRYWFKMATLHQLHKEEILEFTRYLLPLAHQGHYFFYCSLDDLQYIADLRTRPGGHIQYRLLVKEWIRRLTHDYWSGSTFWQPLYDKLPSVDPSSKEQFIDRS